jgi:hypothetical protein
MKILVASHTYIVDLNREKWRALAHLTPEIEVTLVVPRRWKPGGVQNKIIDSEIINNTHLYYMSHKTSFSIKSIIMTLNELESLKMYALHRSRASTGHHMFWV